MNELFKLLVYTDVKTTNMELTSPCLTSELRGALPKLGSNLTMWRDKRGELIFSDSLDAVIKATERLKIDIFLNPRYKEKKLIIKSIKFSPFLLDSKLNQNKKADLKTMIYKANLDYKPIILTQSIILSDNDVDEKTSELLVERLASQVKSVYNTFIQNFMQNPGCLADKISQFENIVIPTLIEPSTRELFSEVYKSINKKQEAKQDKWVINNMGYLKFELKRNITCIKSLDEPEESKRHKINLVNIARKDYGADSFYDISNKIIKQHNTTIDKQIKIIDDMIKNTGGSEELNAMKAKLMLDKILCSQCSSELLLSPPKLEITKGYLMGDVSNFKAGNENLIMKILESSKSVGDSIISSLYRITEKLEEGNYNIDSTLPFVHEINFSINDKDYLISIGKPANWHLQKGSFMMPIIILEKSDSGALKEEIYSKGNEYKNENIVLMIENLKKGLSDKIVNIKTNIKTNLKR